MGCVCVCHSKCGKQFVTRLSNGLCYTHSAHVATLMWLQIKASGAPSLSLSLSLTGSITQSTNNLTESLEIHDLLVEHFRAAWWKGIYFFSRVVCDFNAAYQQQRNVGLIFSISCFFFPSEFSFLKVETKSRKSVSIWATCLDDWDGASPKQQSRGVFLVYSG